MTHTVGKIVKRTGLALAAGITSLFVLAVAPASALDKPGLCKYDHDHRSHAANYYDYYKKDRFFRAGPFRGTLAVAFNGGKYYGKDTRYKRTGYYNNRGYKGNRYDRNRYSKNRDHKANHHKRKHHASGSKLIKRDIFHTRFDAKIVLKEELFYGDYGKKLICTVKAKGYEAEYVPYRRLKRVADKNCSYRAKVKIN